MQPPQATAAATKEDLNLTQDEVKRLEECFKDRKFRDLLSDYVKEISNPQTKLAYEEYLKQVENEGGAPQNRQLMRPIPQFCIKAKVMPPNTDDNNDPDPDRKKHVFINCCSGNLVQDAKLANSNGFDHPLNCSGAKQAGLCWQIPYILGHKRFDPNDGAIIYDIAFSAKTIELSQQQKSFKRIVLQTAVEAVDGVETEYNLYTKLEADGKKMYKILKSTKCKAGNIDPPLMSVYIANDNASKRLVDTTTTKKQQQQMKKSNSKTMRYKIVESAQQKLFNEPDLNKIHCVITIPEQNISIKDIDCQIKAKQLVVNVHNLQYDACRIDLKQYDLIASSMNVAWYKKKQELKVTFDINQQSRNMPKTVAKPIISVTEERTDDRDDFVFREVESKRIVIEEDGEDEKDDNKEEEDKLEIDAVPLCHHKQPMHRLSVKKQGINHGREFWSCCKPLNERCTAFRWADTDTLRKQESVRKRVLTEFEVEKREKFDKVVLLVRITNIIPLSVKVEFEQCGQVAIEFETHHYRYCRKLKLEGCCIDVEQSRFDVNDRNLLIMVGRKEEQQDEAAEDIADTDLVEVLMVC